VTLAEVADCTEVSFTFTQSSGHSGFFPAFQEQADGFGSWFLVL
jgi:hypothetical protein